MGDADVAAAFEAAEVEQPSALGSTPIGRLLGAPPAHADDRATACSLAPR